MDGAREKLTETEQRNERNTRRKERQKQREERNTETDGERESGFWSAVHKCVCARKNIPTFLVKTFNDIKSDPTNTGLENSFLKIEIF